MTRNHARHRAEKPSDVLAREKALAAREKHELRMKRDLRAVFAPRGIVFKPEYVFSDRGWRFDFAQVELKIAIEVEGGVWIEGRHNRGGGFIEDCEKYNTATLLGWKILRFPPNVIQSGEAITIVESLINQRN